ncbi:hypothetical protein J6590_005040 [Homalodisca vitripennis]|nr:hypothetical protein J6590_005040 [Homalodisca vitripennis]
MSNTPTKAYDSLKFLILKIDIRQFWRQWEELDPEHKGEREGGMINLTSLHSAEVTATTPRIAFILSPSKEPFDRQRFHEKCIGCRALMRGDGAESLGLVPKDPKL